MIGRIKTIIYVKKDGVDRSCMYWIEEFHEKLYAWRKSDGGAHGLQEKVDAGTEAYKALMKARARETREQEGSGGAAAGADGASSAEGTPSKRAKERRSRGEGGAGE